MEPHPGTLAPNQGCPVKSHVKSARKSRGQTGEGSSWEAEGGSQGFLGRKKAGRKEGEKRSRDGVWKEGNDAKGNGERIRGIVWWPIEEGACFMAALSTDTHKGWWLLTYLNIGEAANPGPEHREGIKVWSVNVTSLPKRWQSMAS